MFESFAKTNRAGAAQLVSFQDLGEYMGAETLGLLRSSSTVSPTNTSQNRQCLGLPTQNRHNQIHGTTYIVGVSKSGIAVNRAYRTGQMTGQAGRISLTL